LRQIGSLAIVAEQMQRSYSALVRILIALILACVSGISSASAAPQGPITRARAEYVRLRNVDPTGTDVVYRKEWEVLATAMRGILASKLPEGEKLRIRIVAADTHLRLYRATRQKTYLAAATAALTPLVTTKGARGSEETPIGEAYILMGDIQVTSGDAHDIAAGWYSKALTSGSPWATIAQSRLQSLRNGTYSKFIPSRDIATPRIRTGSDESTAKSERPMIVLDPGHGGSDSGAVGPGGDKEKEITLDIARRVKTLLEQRYSYRVSLTREGDDFVPLARRTSYANKKEAVAFVSLHINASAAHDADGLEVYYLDNTNDEASRRLAERENGIAHGESLDDLSFMLSDLIQTGKLEDSIALSRSVEGAIRVKVLTNHRDLRSLGVKKGPFFVLVGAHMPCSLVEMFFIDNPTDAKRLRQEQFRAALAVGIADGIRSFLDKR
jgi:N-acetylmuramoyl-L-alanine amidase